MRFCPQCNSRFVGNVEKCPLDGTPAQEENDLIIGRVVGGRYRVLGRIAEGGMASIYKARQDPLDRTVALKVLSRSLSDDPLQKERFLREARAANKIHHECVIDVTDFGETEDGLVYLVMEYLDGESLAELVGRGPLPIPRVVGIVRQVCQGLQRAHDIGIFHRDLKPENIFLVKQDDGGDHVKILDFGLAQMLGDKRLTTAGQIFGTPEFLSPEQASGGDVDHLTDLYSLGVIIYEMTTGHLPFTGSTARLIYQHLRETPRPPSKACATVPKAVDDIVMRLLEKDPGKRFASARALTEAMGAVETEYTRQERLSTAPSRPVTTAEALDLPPATIDAFRGKVEFFRRAAAAPQAGEAAGDVDAFAGLVGRLGREYDGLRAAARAHEDLVSHGRTTIDRLRKALEELGHDESRAKRELEGLRTALLQARSNEESSRQDFTRAREEMGRHDGGADAPITRQTAMAFETVGRRAKRWREAAAEVEELERDLVVKTEEVEEVRFQIGQFRGRIASLEVDCGDSSRRSGEVSTSQKRLNDAHRGFVKALDAAARAAERLARTLGNPP